MQQFNRWLNKGVVFLCTVFLLGNMALPYALAADACECFCGTSSKGAESIESKKNTNECAQACADAGDVYVGCFTDEALYPENSNLCWTQAECEAYPIDVSGTTYQGAWGEQSAYCSKEIVTGNPMGYCYGPMIPVTLNVPILGVTQVSDLGTYVNLLYKYAIPLAGLFGVLMFTFAGFQYMTAGGDKGAVSKAKARMSNTVIGIIILMSVYAIAYLIDPRLTRFNELRPPLVKQAVLVDDTTTCEALFGYGFCIDGTCPSDNVSLVGEGCGIKGEITGDDEVLDTVVNAPAIGGDCIYSGCSDRSKTCAIKGDKSGGVCVSCADVSDLRESTKATSVGIAPSEAVCAKIAANADKNDENSEHVYRCYYDNDLSALTIADSAGFDECVNFETNEDDYINCNKVKEEAKNLEDGCKAYESLDATSFGQSISAASIFTDILDLGSADQIEDFSTQFEDLCNNDVCSVAGLGEEAHASCSFIEVSVFGILGSTTNHGCTGK